MSHDVPLVRAGERAGPASRSLRADVFDLFWVPSRLFSNLAGRQESGSALLLLGALLLGLGYLQARTGVGDREWDTRGKARIHRAIQRADSSDPQKLDVEIQGIRASVSFWKMVFRWITILRAPLRAVLGVAILSALLFLAVASLGNAPNQRVLTAIVIFCWYLEIPRQILRLALVASLGHERVETSAAAWVSDPSIGAWGFSLLRLVDPFVIWFWILVAKGLEVTGQTRWRQAITIVVLFALLGGMLKTVWNVAWLTQGQAMMGGVESGST